MRSISHTSPVDSYEQNAFGIISCMHVKAISTSHGATSTNSQNTCHRETGDMHTHTHTRTAPALPFRTQANKLPKPIIPV
mmetsp:Transcript_31922/g.70958  ORF Transcript_31922/g.70958 Transcript_31922/m.70958 type:complete len:80 (-) Transcript_31922:991-1230(-)